MTEFKPADHEPFNPARTYHFHDSNARLPKFEELRPCGDSLDRAVMTLGTSSNGVHDMRCIKKT